MDQRLDMILKLVSLEDQELALQGKVIDSRDK